MSDYTCNVPGCIGQAKTLHRLPQEANCQREWLTFIYESVPQNFNPRLVVCSGHFKCTCLFFWGEIYFPKTTSTWGLGLGWPDVPVLLVQSQSMWHGPDFSQLTDSTHRPRQKNKISQQHPPTPLARLYKSCANFTLHSNRKKCSRCLAVYL